MYYFLKDIVKVEKNIAHNDSCLIEHLLSKETRQGLFSFMQNIVKDPESIKLKTELDLDKFKDNFEFTEAQKGDKYL